jgi:hypothetical protein
VISLVIILILVSVPLALILRLSFAVLARLLGVTSPAEVATRAEFARIREQLLATAGDDPSSPRPTLSVSPAQNGSSALAAPHPGRERSPGAESTSGGKAGVPREPQSTFSSEPPAAHWRGCPSCAAEVPSTASLCLRCGAGLGVEAW